MNIAISLLKYHFKYLRNVGQDRPGLVIDSRFAAIGQPPARRWRPRLVKQRALSPSTASSKKVADNPVDALPHAFMV